MLLSSCSEDTACKTAGAVRMGGVCDCPKDTTFRADKDECVSSITEPSGASEPDARVSRADASAERADASAPAAPDAEQRQEPEDASTSEVDAAVDEPKPSEDAATPPDPVSDGSTKPEPVVDAGNQGPAKPDAAAGKPDAAVEPPACVPKMEDCDGADDDCDGKVDEGALNACGNCGTLPLDDCDGKDDDCDGVVDNALTAVCPLGQACTAGKCQPLCGNGKKDLGEACDPTAPGGTVFNCSPSCTPLKILASCTADAVSGPGDCGQGFSCGGFTNDNHMLGPDFCIPVAPCPELPGVEWAMYGEYLCVLPCSNSSQCPLAAPYCYPHPIGGMPTSWCVK